MMKVRARLLVAVAALGAALGGFWLATQLDRGAPHLASGTWLPRPRAVQDFSLTDERGRAFTRADLAGTPTLVFFGFTHCPDVCPTTLVKLAQVKKSAPLAALHVLFVSVDPQRDTPPVLAQYVHAFDPSFQGLTGDPQALARVAGDFGVAFSRVELPGGDYTMDHSAVVFLLDTGAHIVAIFTPPFDSAARRRWRRVRRHERGGHGVGRRAAVRGAAVRAAAAHALAARAPSGAQPRARAEECADRQLRGALPPRHERCRAAGAARLRQLQRLLHPGAAPGRPPRGRRSGHPRLARGRRGQPDRPPRRFVAGAGQGPRLHPRVAAGG